MTYRKLDDELVETPVNPRETTHVWERQCHVELVKHYRPPPTDQKWVTVESKDGGLKGEHVIYRSFVNAEIGGRELRNRSVNQPYMLILHCHDSHPEPKITLCSQRGLLNLTKDCECLQMATGARVTSIDHTVQSRMMISEQRSSCSERCRIQIVILLNTTRWT